MSQYPKMKVDRTYIDLAKAVSVSLGELPTSTPVGWAYDGNDEAWTAFIATDRETGAIKEFGKDGMSTGLNWRKSRKAG